MPVLVDSQVSDRNRALLGERSAYFFFGFNVVVEPIDIRLFLNADAGFISKQSRIARKTSFHLLLDSSRG